VLVVQASVFGMQFKVRPSTTGDRAQWLPKAWRAEMANYSAVVDAYAEEVVFTNVVQ